jgi:hypothetical protein
MGPVFLRVTRGVGSMNFETLAVVAVSTAFLSITAATVAFMASPQNWWVSALLSLAAIVMLGVVAVGARNRVPSI